MDPQLKLTLKLKCNYHLNVKAGKSKIVTHPRCPMFPDNLWTDVLLGHFIDLNKVYSGYYALDMNYQLSQTISDFNISFNNRSNLSKPAKSIKMNEDWGIAFRHTKHAILFAYLHHSEELDKYEEYIIGQFAGVMVSQHQESSTSIMPFNFANPNLTISSSQVSTASVTSSQPISSTHREVDHHRVLTNVPRTLPILMHQSVNNGNFGSA